MLRIASNFSRGSSSIDSRSCCPANRSTALVLCPIPVRDRWLGLQPQCSVLTGAGDRSGAGVVRQTRPVAEAPGMGEGCPWASDDQDDRATLGLEQPHGEGLRQAARGAAAGSAERASSPPPAEAARRSGRARALASEPGMGSGRRGTSSPHGATPESSEAGRRRAGRRPGSSHEWILQLPRWTCGDGCESGVGH